MSHASENRKEEVDQKAQAATQRILQEANEKALKEAQAEGVLVSDNVITDLSKIPPMPLFTYRGVRNSFICYHPAKHGNDEFAFDRAYMEFMRQWNEWWEIVDLYQAEMIRSEKVTVPQLKKELVSILKEVVKDRDPYMLETLAMVLWDKEGATQDREGRYVGKSEKTERHEFLTMREMKEVAAELRALDCGITLDNPLPKEGLLKHTWAG